MTERLVFRDVQVLDGSGSSAFVADVSVVGDRIECVGSAPAGSVEIDGRGRYLAPGFVDVHAHDDAAVLELPQLPFKLAQGCTSVVVGNCGFGLAPLTGDAEPPGNAGLFGPGRRRFRSLREYRALLRFEVGTDAGEVVDLRSPQLGVDFPGRGQERVPQA